MFPSYASKNSHLSHCKKRLLQRFFKIEQYLFTVRCNPLKRKILALNEIVIKMHDPKAVLGAFEGFKQYKLVESYTVTELKNPSDTFKKLPNGIVRYPELKKVLQPSELSIFQSDVEKLKSDGNVNTQEETDTTKEVKK
jgi:hypothetical protein